MEFPQKRQKPRKYGAFCCPAKTRTQTNRTRICRATITPQDNDGAKIEKSGLVGTISTKNNSFPSSFDKAFLF